MEKILSKSIFEQFETRLGQKQGAQTVQACLSLGRMAMHFSQVERAPRYARGEHENDAEHSYMLALVAPEIAKVLELNLDTGLISQYAIVHDLVELKTGDTPTFLFDQENQRLKELAEQTAVHEFATTLPPYTRTIFLHYEVQQDPEARFVRYIDKLLPIVVDIIGQGERVMREEYGVTNSEALKQCHDALHDRLKTKFEGEFPQLDIAHKLLCELFQTIYQTNHTKD